MVPLIPKSMGFFLVHCTVQYTVDVLYNRTIYCRCTYCTVYITSTVYFMVQKPRKYKGIKRLLAKHLDRQDIQAREALAFIIRIFLS
jgi:hypothetical protein